MGLQILISRTWRMYIYLHEMVYFVGKRIGTAYRCHWQKGWSMTLMVTFAGACTISPSILCINHSEVTMWTLWWAWHLLVSPSWMPVSDRSPLKCRSRPLSRAWACWNTAKAIRRRPWNRQGARASWGNHDFLCKIYEYMICSYQEEHIIKTTILHWVKKKTCFPSRWATPRFMMFCKSPIALLWALKNMIHVYMPAYAAHMCSDHDGCPVRISLAISSSPPHQCGAFLVDLEYVKTLSCQKPDRFSQHYVQSL